ncbi:MAG: enoyl-CoA hydratase-related protein [Thermodesulfobacteriota bacterium]
MAVLVYEKRNRVAYITLNRPERMNALNSELLDELEKAWHDFNEDDNVWVAVLSGAGKAFCVGADFESIGQPGIQVGFNVLREDPTVHGVSKPIIGAINGHVIGRGTALMLACDIRIISEKATISIPEVKFGVIPGDTNILEYNIPPAIAREMFLTGDGISAQRAYEVGLVNRVVKPEELMQAATAMAEKLCANSPLALRGIKEMFSRRKDMDYRTPVSIYGRVNRRVLKSEDYKEGMASIKEKRKPNWKGM